MILADIILGSRSWLAAAIALAIVALAVLIRGYWRTRATSRLRVICLILKAAAFVLLAACLVDPLYVGTRPRPGSNVLLVLADNSRSLQLSNPGEPRTRGAAMQASLAQDSPWLTRLAQDFDVRRYTFDTHLEPTQDFHELSFAGEASSLAASLTALAQRYRGQPVAGILLLTDGNATDVADGAANWKDLPPVYPVPLATESPAMDVALSQVVVSQTNFEAAPVTVVAEVETQGLAGRKLVVRVLNQRSQKGEAPAEPSEEIERRVVPIAQPTEKLSQRFLIKPERTGVSFYEVQAALEGEESLEAHSGKSAEATLANNRRLATVDRGGGPYSVLYVSGLPNWEFKFLRRALATDDEVQLVGLVRIAKKEPKFKFLSRDGERTNPLFRGFGNQAEEQAEQYDEPVLVRLGTRDSDELHGGFPKDAEDLFTYQAVILDDVEAGFFTQDQLSLLAQFVGQRGGGLLMMGGKGSYGEGGYARTPVAWDPLESTCRHASLSIL